jgi:hypothetical protein
MTLRWTEEQWKAHLASRESSLPEQVRQLGLSGKRPIPPLEGAKEVKKKRQGVDVQTILDTLKAPEILARYEPSSQALSIYFGGARLLSVNELFSIFQYRKHASFKYKKRWKALVGEALALLPAKIQQYPGTVQITLYRSGKKPIDLDSFYTIFKYLIDGLKEHGVIADDNPWVVARIEPWQVQGSPEVAIQVKPIDPPVPRDEGVRQAWALDAPQPAMPMVKKSSKKKGA